MTEKEKKAEIVRYQYLQEKITACEEFLAALRPLLKSLLSEVEEK